MHAFFLIGHSGYIGFCFYSCFISFSQFEEDSIYRHLEPALAFQLEVYRLRNFDLQTIPTTNHNLHLYLGSAKKVSYLKCCYFIPCMGPARHRYSSFVTFNPLSSLRRVFSSGGYRLYHKPDFELFPLTGELLQRKPLPFESLLSLRYNKVVERKR